MDTTNQLLIRSEELGDHVCDTFEYFWKTNEFNDVVCLLLMQLDEVVKEKDELRDLNSQLKLLLYQ